MNGPRATVVELAVVRLPLRDFFDTEGCMEHCLCNLHGAWFIGYNTRWGQFWSGCSERRKTGQERQRARTEDPN